ncbi:MAG TPA: PP2C family serine/threonine-protein phosphatase [Pyrinomonadaceae bacterium]|nr:PP2C family serine/threonine-protein phosphatase [Pyrinomonadaceae bacterium]
MAGDKHTARWRVVGRSVRGAAHERAGMPNQDAIHWLPESSAGLPLILTVADGHGSRRSFRSATGARLAVETAAQVINDFLLGQTQTENLSATKRAAEEWLPVALVRSWLAAVASHLAAHPFSADELSPPATDGAELSGESSQANSRVAYGTTLLAVAVTVDFILYLQLGDGEILTVSSDGEVSSPLPKDRRLFANETTSMCSQDAWRDFRVCFQFVSNTPPPLILLSTDGYPNSFRDEDGFRKVGSDILEMIRDGGLDMVNDHLEGWLAESTYAGSGDDVTLGLICSEAALNPAAREAEEEKSRQSISKSRSERSSSGHEANGREDAGAPVEHEV